MDDTARLIAFILLASFAIERIAASAKYFLDGWEPTRDKRRKRLRQVLLFALGGAVALAIVDFGNIRIVRYLQPVHPPQLLDYWLTWLVVVAGADRARTFLQKQGGAAEAAEPSREVPPIKIVLAEGATLKELSRAS